MNNKWTWARKESQDVWMNGQYSSRERAIEQAKMTAIDEGLDNIYIGKCEAYLPGSPNADIVIERLGDSLCDEFPTDIVEDYILNISVDDENLLQEKLDNAWSEWLEETDNYPNIYKIADVGEVKVYPKK